MTPTAKVQNRRVRSDDTATLPGSYRSMKRWPQPTQPGGACLAAGHDDPGRARPGRRPGVARIAVAGQRVSGLQKATGTTGLAELTTTPAGRLVSARLPRWPGDHLDRAA